MSSASASVELDEAATREGRTDRSAAAVDRLTRQARACGGDWALGVTALTQALVAMAPTPKPASSTPSSDSHEAAANSCTPVHTSSTENGWTASTGRLTPVHT